MDALQYLVRVRKLRHALGITQVRDFQSLKTAKNKLFASQIFAFVETVFSSCWRPSRTVISPKKTLGGYFIISTSLSHT